MIEAACAAKAPARWRVKWGIMSRQLDRSILAILAFHKIGEQPPFHTKSPWYIPETAFRAHLRYLSSNGWAVISVDTFLAALSGSECLPPRAALLTFDDGYKSLLNVAAPCMREFGYPSVAFIPTRFVGGHNDFDGGQEPQEAICTWADLRELDGYGCSIQSHGVGHQDFRGLTRKDREEELMGSKQTIEDQLGKPVAVFAYPFGFCPDKQVISEVLTQTGYRAACLFEGGVAGSPFEDVYFLPRVAMYPDSDLASLLGSVPQI